MKVRYVWLKLKDESYAALVNVMKTDATGCWLFEWRKLLKVAENGEICCWKKTRGQELISCFLGPKTSCSSKVCAIYNINRLPYHVNQGIMMFRVIKPTPRNKKTAHVTYTMFSWINLIPRPNCKVIILYICDINESFKYALRLSGKNWCYKQEPAILASKSLVYISNIN